ncbi:hypothetical protein [Clostridium novyi]|uniref:hypothetical protein n=1 Tax=Clostridium novyi TaxID=1542 RepID=UPI000B1441A7|nr:hypothetical protein [Clostridium novyi]
MNNYIKYEFKRGFFSIKNKLSIILCVMCMVLYVIEKLIDVGVKTDASYLFNVTVIELIKLLAPILVCLPFVDSYIDDVNSGMNRYLYTKITPLKYGLTKILVNGLLGGLVLLIGSAISFLIFLTRGINGFDNSLVNEHLLHIFNKSPLEYVSLLLLFMFIFGITFSTLGLGLSTIFKNRYISTLILFVLYILSGFFSIKLNATRL